MTEKVPFSTPVVAGITVGVVAAGFVIYKGWLSSPVSSTSSTRGGRAATATDTAFDEKQPSAKDRPAAAVAAEKAGGFEKAKSITQVKISQIHVFPVKSCGGYTTQSAKVLPRGLQYDREWVVLRAPAGAPEENNSAVTSYKVATIRELPLMRCIHATIDEDKRVLCLTWTGPSRQGSDDGSAAPANEDENEDEQGEDIVAGGDSSSSSGLVEKIEIPLGRDQRDTCSPADFLTVALWGIEGVVRNEGPLVAAWLSKCLKQPVLLGRVLQPRNPLESTKHASRMPDKNIRIRFQDMSSLNIITEEGLEFLRGVLADASISAARFRGNIVVAGVPFPLEDSWDTMTIHCCGDEKKEQGNNLDESTNNSQTSLELKTVKYCDRCSVPTIDLNGQRSKSYQPTKYLTKEHAAKHPHTQHLAQSAPDQPAKAAMPLFGLNVHHRVPGIDCANRDDIVLATIAVGDAMEITGFRPLPAYE